MGYLDNTGLTALWSKIKSLVNTKSPIDRGIEYIRGTWTAASGTWTGVSEDSELYDGKQIILYMPFAGSGNATLNLTLADGTTTGAKDVYFENTTRFTTHKGQNSQLHLIYHQAQKLSNGTTYEGWWYVANRDTNDYAAHIGFNYGLWKTKTALYRYQLMYEVDEQTLVPTNTVNNSTATTKTLTSEEFNPCGQVYYYNSTTTINANALVGASLRTQHALVDLRLSFNTGTTLTANKSVYLVMDLQSNGKAKLAASPITQALPSSDDGKLYKQLGRAYDTYRIALYQDKPVYWYKNGGIQEYIRDAVSVNGHSVNSDVPSGAVFTDTTYSAFSGASSSAAGSSGLVPAPSAGDQGKYLRGDGTWQNVSGSGTAGVTSWNGQTGDVTYTAPVTSVNGSTGAVTVSVPTKTSDLQNDSGFITDAGVTSFNGQTGAVTYSAPEPSCLIVDCGTISSLPTTINDAGITADMVVINSSFGTPSAQSDDWTVTTAAGSLTISGTISGTTTLTLYLMKGATTS